MFFYYPSCLGICQVYGPWPKIVLSESYLGSLLLFKLKELIRNCPWEMLQCVFCKEVSGTRFTGLYIVFFIRTLGKMPLDSSRLVGFPVSLEFISVLQILWIFWADWFSSSYWLPRNLKLILWLTFKKTLTCILCILHLISLPVFSF